MDFLFVNSRELSALMGLPHIQQLIYLKGIRPYMDRKTMVVGIKRRISHKQLAEELYVEPHQGLTNSGSPTRPQIKRAVKGLERAGLVRIESDDKHLILRCLLADMDYSNQNKPVPNPSSQPVHSEHRKSLYKSAGYEGETHKPVQGKNYKPVLHHNSEDLSVCVSGHFEKFWDRYPYKHARGRALEEFKKLNPSDNELKKILEALKQEIEKRDAQQEAGQWVPKWKYPANWIAQQCWKDELPQVEPKEKKNETNQRPRLRKDELNKFWESCADGEEFDFDSEEQGIL